MTNNELHIYRSVVSDMSEGIITIDVCGKILLINDAGRSILGFDKDIIGSNFANIFLTRDENDNFVQIILDAIYERTASHNSIVDYYDGEENKKLFINTSFLMNDDKRVGVVAVFSDITELDKLRDAMIAMEEIRKLNEQLVIRNEFIQKTFGRYLSDKIVQDILDSEKGLEIGGKKEYVAIMLTDLRGFTYLSENMNPKKLIEMLNNYLSTMIDIVSKYNGTIFKFMGDAILAVFGAPIEGSMCEYDAVASAIEMQCEMENINEYNRKHNFPLLEMGIGIHAGNVIMGNIGSESNTKYDIIGNNVNLTQRIETFTSGGQIMVSEVVKNKLKECIKVGSVVKIHAKGINDSINIYDVKSLDEYKLPTNDSKFITLSPALNISIYIIKDKVVSQEKFDGKIVMYSSREAVINSDAVCEISTDLKIVVEDVDIYAKVTHINKGNNRITVCYSINSILMDYLT